jgi:hypothetical protein
LRRIWVRLQDTSRGAYRRVGGCNAGNGLKGKQEVKIFLLGP